MGGQIEGYTAIATKKLETGLFLISNPQNSSNPALRINKFQTLHTDSVQLLRFFVTHKNTLGELAHNTAVTVAIVWPSVLPHRR